MSLQGYINTPENWEQELLKKFPVKYCDKCNCKMELGSGYTIVIEDEQHNYCRQCIKNRNK